MYEVYIKNGAERILRGTPKEVRRYNRIKNIRCKRHYFYWLFLGIQIAPIIAIAVIAPVSTIFIYACFSCNFYGLFLLWLSTQLSYPFDLPILKGKFIAVTTWRGTK